MRWHSQVALMTATSIFLSGCASGAIFKRTKLADIDVLSIDARQRLVLVGTRPGGDRVVCTEPSPDAIVARAEALAARGNVPIPSKLATSAAVDAALSASSGESVASIAMRTQTIQLMRDGYFRLCEGYLNGVVTEQEYQLVIENVDVFLLVLLAIDTLGGGGRAPLVAVNAGGKTTTGKDATSTDVTANAVYETINAKAAGMSEAQVQAIKAITLAYLRLVTDREAMRSRSG
jgi:hypothetical protein